MKQSSPGDRVNDCVLSIVCLSTCGIRVVDILGSRIGADTPGKLAPWAPGLTLRGAAAATGAILTGKVVGGVACL